MPRKNIKSTTKITTKAPVNENYLEKLETQVQTNQSKVSMVLGGLIILVLGILIFNYFNKNKPSLGPAQQTGETQQQEGNVSPDNLPGNYTVAEGDTLFTIAEKYYKDGNKFTEIAKENNLQDADAIEVGQVLKIPRLETTPATLSAQPSPTETPTTEPTLQSTPSAQPSPSVEPVSETPLGTGKGGGNETIWGPRIEGNAYTVLEGDWLSTIAGRAYGDIFSFKKLAEANNIKNPDHIEPGMVLVIPR